MKSTTLALIAVTIEENSLSTYRAWSSEIYLTHVRCSL